MFDNLEINPDCPGCKTALKVVMKNGVFPDSVKCSGCGELVEINDTGVSDAVGSVNNSIKKLKDAFKKF